ncbi:acyl-CoA/acyl-ACP dehydrogenase [Bacillus sp. H-16]|uniref:acyl-CoA dehydrogenase family protein n=1 Tax=Alteribacter salitolerans TaxID=2912333 RepID=UPI001963EEA4|nr:acyl-CoA dehydrogenase family protein [Alteribacter salitolerans]MBM7097646.1 acyl-CoA/acyl-ACP dehydrogenase [Alteribacter salitolerans]
MTLNKQKEIEDRQKQLGEVVHSFEINAERHDRERTFPFDNINELIRIGYPSWTVPENFGGAGISLTEMLQHQETIARADGPTALSIGWHMGITKHLGENRIWDNKTYKAFADDVFYHGALLNNAASEPATGSPTRGGKPETRAVKDGDRWIINGRKNFTTMAPILTYFVVSASIEGSDRIGNFLIRREYDGVDIEDTWDSVAMKATGSHDLVLHDVVVNESDLVEYISPGRKEPAGWLLHIPACYIGIARAAQRYATDFAKNYSPNSIEGTIADLPNVIQKIGQMELLVLESRHFLYSVAEKWDRSDLNVRQSMKAELGAVKLSVVNKAMEIVDLAMRIVGAKSLSETNPLQRYYRDVRAGLHNPPMDDMTINQLAVDSINKTEKR